MNGAPALAPQQHRNQLVCCGIRFKVLFVMDKEWAGVKDFAFLANTIFAFTSNNSDQTLCPQPSQPLKIVPAAISARREHISWTAPKSRIQSIPPKIARKRKKRCKRHLIPPIFTALSLNFALQAGHFQQNARTGNIAAG
jgi:hypothetical protein